MLKKFTTVALSLVIAFTLGTVSYTAIDNDSTGDNKYTIENKIEKEEIIKIVTPEDESITSQKTILLSGKTRSNLDMRDITVTVEIYSTRNSAIDYFENDIYINNGLINEELFNEMLSLEVSEDELVKISSKEIELDILGLFNEKIQLLTGKNKLTIIAEKNHKKIFTKDIVVTVTDEKTALEYLQDATKINILDDIKNHILGNEKESSF